MKSFLILFSLFLMGTTLCSCVPSVVGGSEGYNVAYLAGELQASEEVGIDHAWNGTEHALQEMGLKVTDRDRGDLEGSLSARNARGQDVTVRFEQVETGKTLIRIRVGTFGDESLSNAILNRIEEKLGLRYNASGRS